MSVIDPDVLKAIGARPTELRSPIPLYMRVRHESRYSNGHLVSHSVQRNLLYQNLAALILEIPDYYKLRRYAHMENRKEIVISH